jgi:hypothetical protein
VLFILIWQQLEEVSFKALMKDKKSEIERKSIRHNLDDGQKERKLEEKCPS